MPHVRSGAALRPLRPLLDRLAAAGFSPTDRALVVKEYVTWCHSVASPGDESDTPRRRLLGTMSQLVADRLWSLESPDQLKFAFGEDSYLSGLRSDVASSVREAYGQEILVNGWFDMEVAAPIIRQLGLSFDDVMDSSDRERWINALSLSRPESWKTIEDMEMDDEDVLAYVERRSPHFSESVPETSETLEAAWGRLSVALEGAGIGYTAIDPLTASDAVAVAYLADSVDRVRKAYELIGAPSVGLGRIDLGIVSSLDGSSGGMGSWSASEADTHRPVVKASSTPGLSLPEVLIHEFLHAHDALLGRLDLNDRHVSAGAVSSSGLLLSDVVGPGHSLRADVAAKTLAEAQKAHPELPAGLSPLAQAWVALSHDLFHMTDTVAREQRLPLIRSGLVDRWSVLGVDRAALAAAVESWVGSQDTSAIRDSLFHDTVSGLVASTAFADSRSFRADVILAELRITENLSDQSAVYTQFVEHFGDLTAIDAPRAAVRSKGSYGPDYFKDLAEIMARSIQLVLDSPSLSDPGAQPRDGDANPFSRWLVYPERGLAGKTVELWTSFFKSPDVQLAYGRLASSDALLEQAIPKATIPHRSKETGRPKESGQVLKSTGAAASVAPVTVGSVQDKVRARRAKVSSAQNGASSKSVARHRS